MTEIEQLERIATRELRRLDKEEREARRTGSAHPSEMNPSASSSQEVLTGDNREDSVVTVADDDEALLTTTASAGVFFAIKPSKDKLSLLAKPNVSKNSEFNMKLANPEERLGFMESDKTEWQTMLDMKATKVLSKEESQRVMRNEPERVVTSRMIRRKKPVPGVGNFKYKSRWCVHGHQDPDSLELQTFSPMPSTEAIVMFFQLALNMGFKVSFADVKSAFCQAEPLDRPQGNIYVQPCEGLNIPKDQLIQLVAPVYGLNDAPLRWHRTLLGYFEKIGFTRSLLEPCWLIKRVDNKVVAMVLIEVDDLNLASTEEYKPVLRKLLEKRFTFGKFEHDEADFAGRHVCISDSKVTLDQEKYILEKLQVLKIHRGRLADKTKALEPEEFESYRSLLYKVNWLAHQTRPEVSGVVSLLSSRLQRASIYDLHCLNKAVAYLRSSAKQGIILHKFDNEKFLFIAASDAGGVGGLPPVPEPEGQPPEDLTQGAWIVLGSDTIPSASHKTKVSVLSWRSTKLRRKISSTLAAETLAFSQSLSQVEWFQVLFRDVVHGDVDRADWSRQLCPFLAVLKEQCRLHQHLRQCSITDAKSLFDSVQKGDPSSRQDRRTSIELSIICEAMARSKGVLRWTPHPKMIADGLTKDDLSKGNGALEELLKSGKLCLWDESEELARRKEFPHRKGRSKKASEKIREESLDLLCVNNTIQVNKNWYQLSNVFTSNVHGCLT